MERQKTITPIIIKKYSNRRLYNTKISAYVTLDDLRQMIKAHAEFVVTDAKTGEDLTHAILTQIIFEQEHKGEKIFPISFLKQVISLYDDQLKNMLPGYLTQVMNHFMSNQEQYRKHQAQYLQNPVQIFEDVMKQNLNVFDKIMQNFTNPIKK
jgi:polyhydroxyalkanoate synthesis repressor PhaR